MAQTDLPKYHRIRDDLTRAIRKGRYERGQRLPTERELAQEYGVHRMTIRQATAALVKAGLVVRRRPAGVFVRDDIPGELRAKAINLICPATDSAHASVFIECGRSIADEFGYRPRLLRYYPGAERDIIDALAGTDPSILLEISARRDDELGLAIKRYHHRVVSLGVQMESLGVRSILADDAAGLGLAVSCLRDAGHRHLAILCSESDRSNPLQKHQIGLARQAMDQCGLDADAHLQVLPIRQYASGGVLKSGQRAMDALLKRGRGLPFTAMIGLSEDVTNGALSACYDHGLTVPNDLSVLVYAGTERTRYALPPQTRVDVRIDEHVRKAIQLLDAAEDNEKNDELLFLIRPRLVRQKSVAAVSTGAA